MQPTRNDLPEKVRHQIATELNQLLSDAIDLTLQAKQAHWNVRGPNFIGLHKLFDEVYEHSAGHADLIAERIAALGGSAEGTLQSVTPRTRIAPYPVTLGGEQAHVEKLAESLAQFGAFARDAIHRLARLGDMDAADLCTQVSRGTDQDLWFVESHLIGRPRTEEVETTGRVGAGARDPSHREELP